MKTALKEELLVLIEKEDDMRILEKVKKVLGNNAFLKEKLISRAIKADEDIAAGRTFSEEEAIKYLESL